MPHGSENYVIAGEHPADTMAPESVAPPMAGPVGVAAGEGMAAPIARTEFRFSRIGPRGTAQDVELLRAIGRAMVEGTGHPDSPGIPAGFTYLGQFVDHDLTLDLTPVPLGQDVEVPDLVQGRSPTLDLDSVYGRGPRDRRDDRLYDDDGASLRLGVTAAISGAPGVSDAGTAVNLGGYDLPRVANGATKSVRQKALIPDLRNDENLIVAQTHLAFMRFHNAIVAELKARGRTRALFTTARAQVVKHYQWLLRHDFLPRIVEPALLDDVFTHGRRFIEPNRHGDRTAMPVEFSVAAYRLGHSMIRDAYNWNRIFSADGTGPVASLALLFIFSGTSGTFDPTADPNDPEQGVFERLPTNWSVDWRRLYDFTEAGRLDLASPPDGNNMAKLIDTHMEDPLRGLPLGSFGGSRPGPADPDELNLAFRNLRRGAMIRLASGQQMATRFGLAPLTPEQIIRGGAEGTGVNLSGLSHEQAAELTSNTPLWFYVLREAELNGGLLTGVGGRIVAETFHRAMEASVSSIVRDRAWRPTLGPDQDTFRMVDLLLRAFGTAVEDLNPLGDAAPEVATAPAPGASVSPSVPAA